MACVSLRCSSSHTLRSESIMLKSKHRTSYLEMIFDADDGAGRGDVWKRGRRIEMSPRAESAELLGTEKVMGDFALL